MPVGAIIGAGALTAGATAYSSSKNSHAINKATQGQQQSDREQLQFQRDAYNMNTANLSPYMARGNAAGNAINALLGLGGTPATAVTTPALPAPATGTAALSHGLPGWGGYRQPLPDRGPVTDGPVAAGTTAHTTTTPGQTPAQAAAAAYEIFKQSTGYTTRLDQGQRTLASNYFGGGVGQSGAAVKAALRYGQDYASNEFGNYIGALQGQQQIGLGGASALAGVSQTFANNASNISQNGADAAAQAAVARARNSGALWSGLAGTVGNTVGALSSYSTPPFASQTATDWSTPPTSGWGTPGIY